MTEQGVSDPGGLSAPEFAQLNSRMLGLAYRMLGSWADAEDVAAEAWLRWHTSRPEELQSAQGWLTTVATRLSLDRWRTLKRRRETYLGPWLPEPLDPGLLPHETTEQRESLAYGLLHLMERLGPEERAVYVLRHAFGHSFPEIAEMLGRTPASCRQLAHRAQGKLGADRESVGAAGERPMLDALVAAVLDGQVAQAMALLTEDAVLITDGGGRVKAALNPIIGPDKIIRFLVGVTGSIGPNNIRIVRANAGIGIMVDYGDHRRFLRLGGRDGRICAVHMVGNPDKLGTLPM